MRSKTNRVISAAFVFAVLLTSVPFAVAFDEGMYAPDQLSRLALDKKGIKIKASDIYNPAGGGLTDAVIRLSVGCTAEFVSPDGLILTNHHCGFDALVKASTPEKDLIETGFKTDSRAGEIRAQGYSIFVTNRVEDVTAKIMAGTEGMTGDGLAASVKKHTDDLTVAEQAKARPGSTVRIQALNSGYFYYLYETMQVKDVRV
ncbi:MAG: S46 family peptidase, partial [Pyrinomonadaceae bacterium]